MSIFTLAFISLCQQALGFTTNFTISVDTTVGQAAKVANEAASNLTNENNWIEMFSHFDNLCDRVDEDPDLYNLQSIWNETTHLVNPLPKWSEKDDEKCGEGASFEKWSKPEYKIGAKTDLEYEILTPIQCVIESMYWKIGVPQQSSSVFPDESPANFKCEEDDERCNCKKNEDGKPLEGASVIKCINKLLSTTNALYEKLEDLKTNFLRQAQEKCNQWRSIKDKDGQSEEDMAKTISEWGKLVAEIADANYLKAAGTQSDQGSEVLKHTLKEHACDLWKNYNDPSGSGDWDNVIRDFEGVCKKVVDTEWKMHLETIAVVIEILLVGDKKQGAGMTLYKELKVLQSMTELVDRDEEQFTTEIIDFDKLVDTCQEKSMKSAFDLDDNLANYLAQVGWWPKKEGTDEYCHNIECGEGFLKNTVCHDVSPIAPPPQPKRTLAQSPDALVPKDDAAAQVHA